MTNLRSKYGKVAVLMGGDSTEREISLVSGNAVLEALIKSGVNAVGIDANEELIDKLKQEKIDRVLIMLHGRNGEDGKVQAALESIGMPYSGSGVAESEVAMDKLACKKNWLAKGLNTPQYVELNEDTNWEKVIKQFGACFVKPVKEGSSIGIAKVSNADDLRSAYLRAKTFDDIVIAEQWINGAEYTVGILKDRALPVIELRTNNEFYDFEAKYKAKDTQYLCPCDLSDKKIEEIQELSLQAYKAIGCSGWSRVDLMQDKSGQFWLLEVNTIPGMTSHSLVPMAAKEAGINFENLVLAILDSSFDERNVNENRVNNNE